MKGLLDILVTSFLTGLSGAMMPGPLLTQTITQTVRRGFIAAPLLVLGHALLELALVLGFIFGLSGFLTRKGVTAFIALAGGAMLFWMGYDIVRSVRKGEVSFSRQVEGTVAQIKKEEAWDVPPFRPGPVATGIITSASNPYFLLWWATAGLGFYQQAHLEAGLPGAFYFYTGHISSDLIWYGLVGLVVVKGQKYMPEKVYRTIILACGIFLALFALRFIYFGLTTIAG